VGRDAAHIAKTIAARISARRSDARSPDVTRQHPAPV
jgi:hypothetical protein